jgi:phosphoglycerate dehydrogenase-like enzyme
MSKTPLISFYGVWPEMQEYVKTHMQDFNVFISTEKISEKNLNPDTEILAVFVEAPVTKKIIESLPHLKMIATMSTGFDHIDLLATQKWGITVMHTPEANMESVAQLTWSFLLAGCHKLPAAQEQVKQGRWQRDLIVGQELAGKNLGIIGLGRIGQRVAEIAKAFHVNLFAYDPFQEASVFQKNDCERLAFEEILNSGSSATRQGLKGFECLLRTRGRSAGLSAIKVFFPTHTAYCCWSAARRPPATS